MTGRYLPPPMDRRVRSLRADGSTPLYMPPWDRNNFLQMNQSKAAAWQTEKDLAATLRFGESYPAGRRFYIAETEPKRFSAGVKGVSKVEGQEHTPLTGKYCSVLEMEESPVVGVYTLQRLSYPSDHDLPKLSRLLLRRLGFRAVRCGSRMLVGMEGWDHSLKPGESVSWGPGAGLVLDFRDRQAGLDFDESSRGTAPHSVLGGIWDSSRYSHWSFCTPSGKPWTPRDPDGRTFVVQQLTRKYR